MSEEWGGIDGGSGRGRGMGGRGGGGEGGEVEGWRRAEAERMVVALTARTVGDDGRVWAGGVGRVVVESRPVWMDAASY